MAPFPTGRRPPAPPPDRCVACGAPPDRAQTARAGNPHCRPCGLTSEFAADVIAGAIERTIAMRRAEAAAASAAERAAEG